MAFEFPINVQMRCPCCGGSGKLANLGFRSRSLDRQARICVPKEWLARLGNTVSVEQAAKGCLLVRSAADGIRLARVMPRYGSLRLRLPQEARQWAGLQAGDPVFLAWSGQGMLIWSAAQER